MNKKVGLSKLILETVEKYQSYLMTSTSKLYELVKEKWEPEKKEELKWATFHDNLRNLIKGKKNKRTGIIEVPRLVRVEERFDHSEFFKVYKRGLIVTPKWLKNPVKKNRDDIAKNLKAIKSEEIIKSIKTGFSGELPLNKILEYEEKLVDKDTIIEDLKKRLRKYEKKN